MRFYEIITEGNDISHPFWITGDGKIEDVGFQKHASAAAHLLDIEFDRDDLSHETSADQIYDMAYDNGWVRVDISQGGRSFYIALSPAVAKKAKRVLIKQLKEYDEVIRYIHVEVVRSAANNEVIASESFERIGEAIRLINRVGKGLK
jgi:hypothetical protein